MKLKKKARLTWKRKRADFFLLFVLRRVHFPIIQRFHLDLVRVHA